MYNIDKKLVFFEDIISYKLICITDPLAWDRQGDTLHKFI